MNPTESTEDVVFPLTIPLTLRVNGFVHELAIDPRLSLLDALREELHLSGTKKGCNQGACGACTVLVDGERILSCLSLALQHDGHDIVTVEGLAEVSIGSAMQSAFIEADGFQCGYCTPGQICSAVGMLSELERGIPSAVTPARENGRPALDDAELKERMSGNLCRCGAYVGICEAIRAAHDATEKEAR
jgi:xanthine dehydrogenase YagT iron-sulfur-binding subunit